MKPTHHRVLVVDDDIHERFFSSTALEGVMPPGSTVHLASSGNEAITYMMGEGKFADRKQFPFPTLVLCDLNMPNGDGFDVLEFLQKNPEWAVIPRILYSDSVDDDDVRTAYVLGASAYHLKPNRIEEMEETMRRIMNYWGACEIPPIDEGGRLLPTNSEGRPGARYPQKLAGRSMERPRKPGPA